MYMEGDRARNVIRWAAQNFKTAVFINYDPVSEADLVPWKTQERLYIIILIYYYRSS